MGRYEELSFDKIKTYSARTRHNLVRIDNLMTPGVTVTEPYGDPHIAELCARIKAARADGREVIWSQGAHVIKNGLSRYIIDLCEKGFITRMAGNGACSIHDFELAYLGGTSEDVPTAITDGSFGMWEETGSMMNEAIKSGVKAGMGYGESLGYYIDTHADRFPYREDCLIWRAYRLGIPYTFHIAIGTDIIHEHPSADFGAIGEATGRDFRIYCKGICGLDRGVFLNFGSGVIGPEVFLKALAISRNLGYKTYDITTANFDLRDLGDFTKKIGYDDPDYYYRPRKNIVNRPTSDGGWGRHFTGDHKVTVPEIWGRLTGGTADEKV